MDKVARTHNSGFKKLAVQWLNQVPFSNQTFVQADSFVLRNRQLLVAANRYGQCYYARATLKETTCKNILLLNLKTKNNNK
jgi:hypothetical protein